MIEYTDDKPFDYVLILDFEATCWDKDDTSKNKGTVQEIIEFPVLAIDVKKLEVAYKFHHYIKPTENPILSKFCTELTGIEQNTVDKGILLTEALSKLDDFMKETNIIKSNFIIATCGDQDLKQCLREEAKYKKITLPDYLKKWINIKFCFNQYAKNDIKQGMVGMLNYLGLQLEGRHHSGIDDCHNISRIAIYLLKNNISLSNRICQFVPKVSKKIKK